MGLSPRFSSAGALPFCVVGSGIRHTQREMEMFRFVRRAAGFGLQMTLFGLAMATFATAAVYQKLTDRSDPSEPDDEESANAAASPSADRGRSGRSNRAN